ncbi:hypothetical protein GJ496_004751 [Pomphorhynchus laevis]|nr:hypothetical protein GJ496_004751 [Pomphorhynchus laevis]
MPRQIIHYPSSYLSVDTSIMVISNLRRTTLFNLQAIFTRYRTRNRYQDDKARIVAKEIETGDLEECYPFNNNTNFMLNYENSKELQSASDDVKKLFTLAYNDTKAHNDYYLNEITSRIKLNKFDDYSTQFKIAELTANIRYYHMLYKQKPSLKGYYYRIQTMVVERNQLFEQLYSEDYDEYVKVKERLKVEHNKELEGPEAEVDNKYLNRIKYNEESLSIIEEKRRSYKAEIEQQKLEFEKYKNESLKQILAEIDSIESELQNMNHDSIA